MRIGFTQKAQNALNRALYYACEMGHTCVGSEHLLLGLLSEKDGVAKRVLEERNITFEKTRELLAQNVGTGTPTKLTAADITPRTKKILAATPMGRFGEIPELEGTLLFLVNDKAAGFITGVVIPVDGGFSAYSGV